MSGLDWLVLILFAGLTLAAGLLSFIRQPRAGTGSEQAERPLPAWMLGLSAGMSGFDVVLLGWMAGLFYTLGLRAIWLISLAGILNGALAMAFTGRWARRSRAASIADLIQRRFGNRRDGLWASRVWSALAVLCNLLLATCAIRLILDFSTAFAAESGALLAGGLIAAVSVYTIAGGRRAVIINGVVQSMLFLFASLVVAVLVSRHAIGPEVITNAPAGWLHWWPGLDVMFVNTQSPAGEGFRPELEGYGASAAIVLITALLLGAGGLFQPAQFQRLLSAGSEREAALAGLAWGLLLAPRITVAFGVAVLARVSATPEANPAVVLPVVFNNYLPGGVRGVAVAGLLFSFLAAFAAAVQSGADEGRRARAGAGGEADSSFSAQAASAAILILIAVPGALFIQGTGLLSGWVLAAGPALAVPLLLPWVWWRTNGWGFASGIIAAIAAAACGILFGEDVPYWAIIPAQMAAVSIVSIVVSKRTLGTEVTLLKAFYRQVRPGGFWWPVHREVASEDRAFRRSPSLAVLIFTAVLASAAFISVSLSAAFAMIHQTEKAALALAAALLCGIVLFFTLYWHLPKR